MLINKVEDWLTQLICLYIDWQHYFSMIRDVLYDLDFLLLTFLSLLFLYSSLHVIMRIIYFLLFEVRNRSKDRFLLACLVWITCSSSYGHSCY